jgi:hypothetical protein
MGAATSFTSCLQCSILAEKAIIFLVKHICSFNSLLWHPCTGSSWLSVSQFSMKLLFLLQVHNPMLRSTFA